MKYLVVLLVVGVAAWMWLARSRVGRRTGASPGQGPAAPGRAPQDIVACAHCGVHLPQADGVAADGRLYCSDAHRLLGPRADMDRP